VNQNDFRRLAVLRLREARALRRSGFYAGAHYLSGHVVEYGLKACIAKQTERHDFPDRKKVIDSYMHELTRLVRMAGLDTLPNAEIAADPDFARNWAIVSDWTEESRYQMFRRLDAQRLYLAVASRHHGVLR
jgi:hypothetical protein